MDNEQRAKPGERLESIGIDRLLADQTTSFINTVGGPVDHAIYAGDWLREAIQVREKRDASRAKVQQRYAEHPGVGVNVGAANSGKPPQ
jgi:hypothetical protein